MNKKLKEQVLNKYKGKCAYCGVDINEDTLSITHIEPHTNPKIHFSLNNLLPSCPMCSTELSLEAHRRQAGKLLEQLDLYVPLYAKAKSLGLIQETPKPIKFYFETLNPTQNEQ